MGISGGELLLVLFVLASIAPVVGIPIALARPRAGRVALAASSLALVVLALLAARALAIGEPVRPPHLLALGLDVAWLGLVLSRLPRSSNAERESAGS